MIKKILLVVALVLVVAIVGLCVAISLQPDTYSVERSEIIGAPPAEVFAQVNDFKAWDGWSPWKELDPDAKMSISTPSTGKGATYTWNGNDQVGEGSLTILESKPDELVAIEQEFVRPFAGKARMSFLFLPVESGTKLTMKMDGTNDFLGKAMCLFMDLDAMLGKDFERGLANIKQVVEKKEVAPAEAAQAASPMR